MEKDILKEKIVEKLDLLAPIRIFDDSIGETVHEVCITESWIEVKESVWKSWTGHRRLNGEDYHGPVYNLDTDVVYNGARACGCSTCQSNVPPALKVN